MDEKLDIIQRRKETSHLFTPIREDVTAHKYFAGWRSATNECRDSRRQREELWERKPLNAFSIVSFQLWRTIRVQWKIKKFLTVFKGWKHFHVAQKWLKLCLLAPKREF